MVGLEPPWRCCRRPSCRPRRASTTIFAQLRNGPGLLSPVVSDSIMVDRTPPTVSTPTVSLRTGPLADDAASLPITVGWEADEPVAGLSDASVLVDCGELGPRAPKRPASAAPGERSSGRPARRCRRRPAWSRPSAATVPATRHAPSATAHHRPTSHPATATPGRRPGRRACSPRSRCRPSGRRARRRGDRPGGPVRSRADGPGGRVRGRPVAAAATPSASSRPAPPTRPRRHRRRHRRLRDPGASVPSA